MTKEEPIQKLLRLTASQITQADIEAFAEGDCLGNTPFIVLSAFHRGMTVPEVEGWEMNLYDTIVWSFNASYKKIDSAKDTEAQKRFRLFCCAAYLWFLRYRDKRDGWRPKTCQVVQSLIQDAIHLHDKALITLLPSILNTFYELLKNDSTGQEEIKQWREFILSAFPKDGDFKNLTLIRKTILPD